MDWQVVGVVGRQCEKVCPGHVCHVRPPAIYETYFSYHKDKWIVSLIIAFDGYT